MTEDLQARARPRPVGTVLPGAPHTHRPRIPSPAARRQLSLLDFAEETGTSSSIGELRAGKRLVIDFWHTRCVQCPDALSKLDTIAPKHPDVTFAA